MMDPNHKFIQITFGWTDYVLFLDEIAQCFSFTRFTVRIHILSYGSTEP